MHAEDRPMFEWIPHPSFDALEGGLRDWARRRPDRIEVREAGRSAGCRAILAVTVTDRATPDADKQRVLVTATHAGPEYSPGTGLLHFVKWLISDDDDAARYRRLYRVVVMPCLDPDVWEEQGSYRHHDSAYNRLNWNDGGDLPESQALHRVLEDLQPEAHIDVHGISFKDSTMWESTAIAWGASLSRCYEPQLTRFIDDVVERRGYLVTRGEHDAGQILSAAPVPGAEDHYYMQKLSKNACCVSYHRYHSLAFAIETGFDDSTVLRLRALLKAGTRRWRYQRIPQLPCDHVHIFTPTQLAAWGETAADRRASRLALWRQLRHIGIGCAHFEHRRSVGSVVTFTPEGARMLGQPNPKILCWRSKAWPELLEQFATTEQFDADGLRAWLSHRPRVPDAGRFNDGISLCGPRDPEAAGVSPPAHGAVIRMLIPDRDAHVSKIALDGHPLRESPTDGYTVTRNPGCVVHVAIPPGKVRHLHIATCLVEPSEERIDGFTAADWTLLPEKP